MKYVIYTRASTDKDNTISHEMQIEDCLKIVGKEQWIHFKEDDISGDSEIVNRPGLMEAISALKRGDTFLVWKQSRLCRHNYRLYQIIELVTKKGAKLQSFSEPTYFQDNPEAQMHREMAAVFSRYELETIRANVRRAMKRAKADGRCVGKIPYGYSYYVERVESRGMVKEVKWLYPNEQEQAIINRMIMLKESDQTYREIAETLNGEGVFNRQGKPWTHSTIYRILQYAEMHREVTYQAPPHALQCQ